ncbi:MAG TPA: hypothetical protein VH417_09620 [Vicinamibacterales bacterium]|jgi:hypothetical protein
MKRTVRRVHTYACALVMCAPLVMLAPRSVSAQGPVTKAHVADQIVKVENGVDDFRKYLEKRGENAKSAADSPAGKRRSGKASQSQKATAEARKDDLDDALGDLNKSTNRLRRKFDATDTWMQTKSEVERVIDDGRKINQIVARGAYGTEVARLWSALRAGMNDLARTYGVTPLGV